jgi:hypothetical protein
MRRDVLDRYVVLMGDVAARLRAGNPDLRALTPGLVLGAVGGVNEIVMRAIETGPVAAVTALAGVTGDLWAALLTAPAAPPGP